MRNRHIHRPSRRHSDSNCHKVSRRLPSLLSTFYETPDLSAYPSWNETRFQNTTAAYMHSMSSYYRYMDIDRRSPEFPPAAPHESAAEFPSVFPNLAYPAFCDEKCPHEHLPVFPHGSSLLQPRQSHWTHCAYG